MLLLVVVRSQSRFYLLEKENDMSGKKLILESGQRYAISGEAPSPKEEPYALASFIEISKKNVFKKPERLSESQEKPARFENREEAQDDTLTNQAKIINQVCAVLLKTIVLFFTAAITIAILQALF
jgi:hypothetical protein